MPRSLGSLKMPTYWMRVPCDKPIPVQPTPSAFCSMPCSDSTAAHSANAAIIFSTRSRRSRPLAKTTNASTTGANFSNCSSAPPNQPLNTCENISTPKNSSSTA